MCYNYEFLIVRGIKKSSHESGEAIDINSLSEKDKKILQEKAERLKLGDGESSGGGESNEKEIVSSFPGQETPVIPITTRQREFYVFGFLPSWAKSFKDNKANFNARSETILEKPTWKKAFKDGQRCLVPTCAFYETDRSTKKRYRFTVIGKEEIFYAGIFNHWTDKETGQIHKTFAIITTSANDTVNPVHDRMPVILDDEGQKIWMDKNSSIETLVSLFKPYPAELMESQEAPPLVRKKKSGPELNLEF